MTFLVSSKNDASSIRRRNISKTKGEKNASSQSDEHYLSIFSTLDVDWINKWIFKPNINLLNLFQLKGVEWFLKWSPRDDGSKPNDSSKLRRKKMRD